MRGPSWQEACELRSRLKTLETSMFTTKCEGHHEKKEGFLPLAEVYFTGGHCPPYRDQGAFSKYHWY